MPKIVFDTSVLVSAFLKQIEGAASFELLRFSESKAYELFISDDILEETARVLLEDGRRRKRYQYPDEAVIEFCQNLGHYATVVTEVPEVRIIRDPNDDMIVACAIAAGADYLVTRDKDILSLDRYEGIRFVTPEALLKILRERNHGTGTPGETGDN
jgi:putative PIN family toxin of toxin-antitoxin system